MAPGSASGRGNGSGAGPAPGRGTARCPLPADRRPPTAARRPPPTAHPAGPGGRGTVRRRQHRPRHPRYSPSARPPPECRVGECRIRTALAAFPQDPPTAFPAIPRSHSPPPPTAFRKVTAHHALIKKSGAFLPAHRTCYKGSPGGSTWDAARRSASGPGLRAPPPRRGDRPRPTRKPLGVAPRLPVRHIRVTGDSKSLASIAECSPLCRTSRTRGSVSRRHLLTRLDAPERGRIRP